MEDLQKEGFRHSAAKLIAKQQDVVAGMQKAGDEQLGLSFLNVVKAVCLLSRNEVPEPDRAALVVAAQFLESSQLITRLAELEELTLPYATLSKLGLYTSQDNFADSGLLPPFMFLVADCIQKLYACQCNSLAEHDDIRLGCYSGNPQVSPRRNIHPGLESPARRRFELDNNGKTEQPILDVDNLSPRRVSGEREDWNHHSHDVDTLRALRNRQQNNLTQMKHTSKQYEDTNDGLLRVGSSIPVRTVQRSSSRHPDELLNKAIMRYSTAARTVKRVTPSDMDRLASHFSCPQCFVPYCIAMAAIFSVNAPSFFKRRSSLGGAWNGLRQIISKPTLLCQLITDCDPFDTPPMALEYFSALEGAVAPVSQLARASPAALALANWAICFVDKWAELGRPLGEDVDPNVHIKEVNGNATPRNGRTRTRTPTHRNRNGVPGYASPTRASEHRSASIPKRRHSRNSRVRSSSRPTVRLSSVKGITIPLGIDEEVLEENLVRTLVDIRTLTARDFAILSTHVRCDNELSRIVQATIEGVVVITGLGGDNPRDGTVDFWEVGIAALQNQPGEVMNAVRALETCVMSEDILHHVASLTSLMGTESPTPYLAVNVLRSWLSAMVNYQLSMKSRGRNTLEFVAKKADAALQQGLSSPIPRMLDVRTTTNDSIHHPPSLTTPVAVSISHVSPAKQFRDSEITILLEGAGLAKYLPVFREHEVDIDSLRLLREVDLTSMGLAIGPKRKLMDIIDKLR